MAEPGQFLQLAGRKFRASSSDPPKTSGPNFDTDNAPYISAKHMKLRSNPLCKILHPPLSIRYSLALS